MDVSISCYMKTKGFFVPRKEPYLKMSIRLEPEERKAIYALGLQKEVLLVRPNPQYRPGYPELYREIHPHKFHTGLNVYTHEVLDTTVDWPYPTLAEAHKDADDIKKALAVLKSRLVRASSRPDTEDFSL